ncbi:hypothetical protein [Dyadobacter diqingensis]|uniref:hypothetical protein n=1 Tax=Dyadobacter diqingensis TaxID=2938121 RepID=UPI0020C4063E|nr:hypothetical protein [Dyadobacter diqingensis]
MIRSAEIRMTRSNKVHDGLFAKVRAMRRSSSPWSYNIVGLTPEECKLIRKYNTDYCAILAENDDEGEFQSAEIKEIYQMATNIQMLFSPRYY